MKKLFLSILVLFALVLSTGVNVNTAKADIDPECPNGCVCGCEGCYCYELYPYYSEAVWPE